MNNKINNYSYIKKKEDPIDLYEQISDKYIDRVILVHIHKIPCIHNNPFVFDMC